MGIPSLRFSCSAPKSLCPPLPSDDGQAQSSWGNGCPRRLGLGRQISGQENWPVHGIDNIAYPWLLCSFCWELQDRKASSNLFRVVSARHKHLQVFHESGEVDKQAETLKLGLCACVYLPFPKANGKHRFSPHFWKNVLN